MLAGRDAERARLASVVTRVQSGQPDLLGIVGAAGIGKSALLAHIVEHAGACRVVRWRGVAAQAQLPFAALCGLLGELLNEVQGLDGGARSALEGAFGLAEPQPVGRLRIAAAVMTLLARAADDGPLLFLVDDLHWVDTESIEALFFAVRRLPADPVGLVVATRDRTQGESLGIETLALRGLSAAAVREIIGRDVAGSVCAMISAVTEGNPLASKEIASTLTAAQRVGRAPLPDPLPETSVERVYMDRIGRAPQHARRAGAVAAAAGDAPLAVVAAALAHLGLGLDALHAIEDAGLLRAEGGVLSWWHPLATSATWRSASAAWQHDAHRALAAAWQRADADGVDRAVWHRAAVATPGDELVASELAGQAERAAARDAYTTAASGWQIAARLGDRALRAERLYCAARACEAAGKLAEERALLRELLAGEPTPAIRARSLRALGRAEFEVGTPALALALLADAAEQSADKRDRLWCLSEAVFASMYAEDRTASLRLAAEATTVADHHDPIQRFLALHASGAAQCLTGDLDSGRRSLDEALRTADEHRLLDEHPELLLWVVNAPLFMGRVGDLNDPAVLRTFDAMRRAGDLTWLPRALRLLGHRHRRAGQWLAAYALFEESVDLARLAGQATQVAEALDALASVEAARGELATAIAHAEESRRLAALHAVPWLVPAGWCTEAMALLASGDAAGALAPMEQAMTLASAHGHAHDVDLIADYVEILVAAGHDARARDVAEAVTAASPDLPAAARARALVTDGEDGLALLDVACTAPDPFDAARGHLLLGRRLRRAGLRRRARTHLDEAAKIFDGLGAAAWATLARTELASRGAQATRAPLGQLTAAELRIAVLVAEGRPTRDVAGLLFLSSKTVEFHLSSIYRKLGVGNRTALAVYMSTQQR